MKIRTEYAFPPIPIRSHDWLAIDDDTYDGPGSKIGHGPTEQAAIDDLLEKSGGESSSERTAGSNPAQDKATGNKTNPLAPDRFLGKVKQ